MKTLIVYYSRTGNTRKLAEKIASALDAEILQIHDEVDRSGLFGYLRSLKEALSKQEAKIRLQSIDPSQFDVVIVGTPVWASSMSSPVRAFLDDQAAKFNRVALFCTLGGNGGTAALRQMQKICKKLPVATMEVTQRNISSNAMDQSVQSFVSRIKAACEMAIAA